MNTILNIGDSSDNGQITIIDEDRLCYLVKSTSRGAYGLRTISKSLLDEYIDYFGKHPDATANDARDALSGLSDIDKFEYGYSSTLRVMALMALGQIEKFTQQGTSIPHKNRMFDFPLQQIFYGAPGTGKSHRIKEIIKEHGIDEKEQVIRTTFHPDSDYSTFVGAYKPTIKPVADKYKAVAGKDEEITYSFVPQAFLQAYVAAWNNQDENVYLIIEEINRGNCAQIFGDLFQLLDRDSDGFSEYPIMADKDLANYLKGKDEDGEDVLTNKEGIKDGKLRLPKNLYIWATMNTSDQSLFPIDSAFKRRWEWKYVPIDTKKEEWHILVNKHKYSWTSFLDIINDTVLTDETAEDKHLGFYFCKAENSIISAEKFVGKVLFYLWNDVFKVYGVPSQITNGSKEMTYAKFYNPDGSINEDKVEKLLDNLNVDNDKKNEAEASSETESNA